MTSRGRSAAATIAGVFASATIASCGAGTPVSTARLPDKIEVRISAGAPVAGATVTVYAISDVTGLPDGTVGAGGVLGSAALVLLALPLTRLAVIMGPAEYTALGIFA